MLELTRGWEADRVQRLVRETLQEIIDPLVYAEALELFEEHRQAGRDLYLVSSSGEEVVNPLAEYLGVPHVIATRAGIDDDGRYDGTLDFYAYGPYKADAIREEAERRGLDLAESYAYSDSVTDVPMLEAVGHPVAVNPDRDLRRTAMRRAAGRSATSCGPSRCAAGCRPCQAAARGPRRRPGPGRRRSLASPGRSGVARRLPRPRRRLAERAAGAGLQAAA